VEGATGTTEALEARLTRYLIADDVEVLDLTGKFKLIHWIGPAGTAPEGVSANESDRFGITGVDWWVPADFGLDLPDGAIAFEGDDLEAFRIANAVPVWGRELREGILPPEAGLDATDVSYQKGCYIGQEVISRIKSAGKVNKRLTRMRFDAALPVESLQLVDAAGAPAGELTSISPLAEGGVRAALGYVKRGVEEVFVRGEDGVIHPVAVA
jgi:folate-binding protein YgfZ